MPSDVIKNDAASGYRMCLHVRKIVIWVLGCYFFVIERAREVRKICNCVFVFLWGFSMIISRTPFRISFVGGGSDLAAFYRRRPGAVVSATINKYMYVTLNRRFDDSIRVSYSQTEIVDKIDDIKHELVREALGLVGVHRGIEVTTIADVPAGTGLGSSSSLTVGILHALYAYVGKYRTSDQLARESCYVEIDRVGKVIGKQDQFAAAFGGLNLIQFYPDESVFVDPIIVRKEIRNQLFGRLQLFFLGRRENGDAILRAQVRDLNCIVQKREKLARMVDFAHAAKDALVNSNLDEFGELIHENWEFKKRLAPNISDIKIDEWYESARAAGAMGGKISGAGGGGFLMLFCRAGAQSSVRETMTGFGLRELEFDWEPQGSKIIFFDG